MKTMIYIASVCRCHTDSVYGVCPLAGTQVLLQRVAACISSVSSSMMSNRLQLNAAAITETARQKHFIPSASRSVCSDIVMQAKYVRDCDMSTKTHVPITVPSFFAALCQMVPQPASSAVSLVLQFVETGLQSIALSGISRRH